MDKTDPTKLRQGWTTGACAAAAAKAAYNAMLTGVFENSVQITLPHGQQPCFALTLTEIGKNCAKAGIIKDAGDDPDVTHQAMIIARVSAGITGTAITFKAGEGVGTVTLPGLPLAVGEPAINPVPRQMIEEALTDIALHHAMPLCVTVEISIPNGAEIARHTWNGRLGIIGGLSILGTTGIVRPFSCSAWIASIHRGVDVSRAASLTHVMAATGATSEATVQKLYNLPDMACLDMGDFVGGLLKYLRKNPIDRLTIAGGLGKMTKLAQGAIDLHSGRSQVDFTQLAALANSIGLTSAPIANANTALEAHEIGGTALSQAIADLARQKALDILRGAPVDVEVILLDRVGRIVTRSDFTHA